MLHLCWVFLCCCCGNKDSGNTIIVLGQLFSNAMAFYCAHRKVLRFSCSYLFRTISCLLHFDWNYNSDSEHVINTANRLYCIIWHRINAPTMRWYFCSSLEPSSFMTLHIKFRIISPVRENWSSHSHRIEQSACVTGIASRHQEPLLSFRFDACIVNINISHENHGLRPKPLYAIQTQEWRRREKAKNVSQTHAHTELPITNS